MVFWVWGVWQMNAQWKGQRQAVGMKLGFLRWQSQTLNRIEWSQSVETGSDRRESRECERWRQGWAVIYPPVCMLYSFLNSTPATINGVNVEIISIFWWQGLKYGGRVTSPSNCRRALNQQPASLWLKQVELRVLGGWNLMCTRSRRGCGWSWKTCSVLVFSL